MVYSVAALRAACCTCRPTFIRCSSINPPPPPKPGCGPPPPPPPPPGAHAISIDTNAERAAVYIIDRHPSLPLSLFSLSLARSLSLSLSPSIETNTERAAVDVINGSDRRRLDSPFIPHFAVARAAGQVHPDLRAPRHVHGVADGKEEGKPRKHARRIGSWEDGNVHVAVELAVKIACVYVI